MGTSLRDPAPPPRSRMAELGRPGLPRRRTATVIARMSSTFERAIASGTIDESWSAPLGPNGGGPPFDRATPSGRIDKSWPAPLGPKGGYVAAVAIRALEPLFPGRAIRSLTCHYLRSPKAGPIDLRAEVVRDGRRMATARLSGF